MNFVKLASMSMLALLGMCTLSSCQVIKTWQPREEVRAQCVFATAPEYKGTNGIHSAYEQEFKLITVDGRVLSDTQWFWDDRSNVARTGCWGIAKIGKWIKDVKFEPSH